jgi:RNA polymerase-binding transcription factor DksA
VSASKTHASSAPSMLNEARRSILARKASLSPEAESSRAELLELEAALARIEAGTWGRCETCGGAVGRTRLRALPEARQCLSCARGS